MPFYEYQCANCGHHLEAMQKISDAPLRKCPSCGKSQLKRLVSAPVFRLKGSGWYETDFKSDKEDKRNLAEHPESKEEKKEATAESKPAEKSEGAEKSAAKTEEKGREKAGEKKTVVAAPSKKVAAGSGSGGVRRAKPAARPVRKPAKSAAKSARRR